jgi:predicted AlkP superfamily pyrophosphatase or phosphodiesterase
MKRTAVINVVGLTEALLGPHTPRLGEFAQRGALARISPAFPAVTCTAQSTYLTGKLPADHGIVGNGWYHRELAEVQFWKQSNRLVRGEKIWDELRAREAGFTCAKLFWWFNMYSTADYSITPRPMYPADGRKVFDIYTQPGPVRHQIKRDLGEFPFTTFWGPAAGVPSPQGAPDAASRWIAESAKWIENKYAPTLSLIYLPHLDYNLQRHGPFLVPERGPRKGEARSNVSHEPAPGPSREGSARAGATEQFPSLEGSGVGSFVAGHGLNPAIIPDLRAIDAIVGGLLDFFRARDVQVIVLSEYGITNVDTPIHLNRLFRELGGKWLAIREELGLELLNPGASSAFAVADHQVAHIYLNDPALRSTVRSFVERHTGATVLGPEEKAAAGIDHPRAGDLVAVAPENSWFTYYYWLEDSLAPDFARTVDIHRKPGYDPVELFADPALSPLALKAKIAWRLLQKKLGFRMLMDVIPLDASLVKGSHGRCPANPQDWPVFITGRPELLQAPQIESTDVFHALLRHVLH